MEREFGYYTATVTAGPMRADVQVDVVYYDDDEEEVGRYGEGLVAFATTWKDVALTVRTGLQKMRLDRDPVHNVSPMVDLT